MTKVWAHRGASGYAPENTLPAFALAVEQEADGIELDVQLTKDGEIVVIHDETLDRTTSGQGWVKDQTWKEIKRLDASGGQTGFASATVPTLADVFDLIADTTLTVNIEIKDSLIPYPGIVEKVLDLVGERDWEYRIVISSFNHLTLAHIRQLGSLIYTGVLFGDVLYEPWNYAQQLWATALHPNLAYVDHVPDMVAEAHNCLLEINTWTVNQVDDIDRMIEAGVDGIITNYPDLARQRLALSDRPGR